MAKFAAAGFEKNVVAMSGKIIKIACVACIVSIVLFGEMNGATARC